MILYRLYDTDNDTGMETFYGLFKSLKSIEKYLKENYLNNDAEIRVNEEDKYFTVVQNRPYRNNYQYSYEIIDTDELD